MKKKPASKPASNSVEKNKNDALTAIGPIFGLPVMKVKTAPSRPKPRKRKPKARPAAKAQVQTKKFDRSVDHGSWTLADFEVDPQEDRKRFHDFDIQDQIMHGIADLSFRYCTPIQAEVLDKTLAGQDALGRAQTGTGKSAAFLITLLARFLKNRPPEDSKNGCPRALIIAPTRELVMQIAEDGHLLAKYTGLNIVAVYGGMDYQKQQDQLEDFVDIVVATPGRLLDFQRRRVINLGHVEIFVIDEADRMLDMGFIPDVRQIIHHMPAKQKRQTMLFSATLTPDVNNLAAQWTTDPVLVEIEPETIAVDTVEQIVYLVTADAKYALLYNIITQQKLERVMVFANRRDETRRLTELLKHNNISCAMLSGEVPQKKRIKTLEDFKAGRTRVLVATDVAGRGIHIDDVSHVINFTLPYDPEDYVHRIGRTGRAGKKGTSISFACEEGSFYIPDIEEYMSQKLPCTEPPEEWLTLPESVSKKKQSPRRPRYKRTNYRKK